MDIMDTGIVHLAENTRAASDEIQGEYDVELVRKVVNLNRRHKELVNRLLDASDQCKDIIDLVLSSTNTMLNLMQKIVKTNIEELNLLMKITELTSKEWELVRKFMYLCNEDRYFVCKFMDLYLNGEGFGFPCSCSTIREVDCLLPAEGQIGTQHNLSRKEINKTVSCKETKIGNLVVAAGENLGIISGDINEKVDAQLSGKEGSKDISKLHDFSLMIKNKINSVSVKSCCVKLEPLSVQTVEKGKRTVSDNNAQAEVSFHPENVEVNSGNLTTVSGDKLRKVPAHLSLKESMEITDLHNSSLTIKDSTNSVPEKRCLVQPEIESECVKLNDCEQECLPSQTKLRIGKITVTDSSTEKEASLSSKNAKSSRENLSIISEDEIEKVDAHLSGKENTKMIANTCKSFVTTRKNSNSVSEKEYSVEAETENECVRSNNEQELIPRQSKLRSHKRAVFDNRKEKYISLPLHNMKVSNKARICQEVKCNDVNSYATFESKCKGEWSAIAFSSLAEETNVSPSGSREITRPTDEVKSNVDMKYNKMKLCTSLKEIGFITHGINMFTIATSMTRFLHAVEKKKVSSVLVKKALSFFAQARATYSSLEKYLTQLQQNEKIKNKKLSECAFKMLQFMLKLQQSISQRHVKGGVNMNLIIMDITHVMDMVAEIIMVASKKEDEMQGQRLDEEKASLNLRLSRQKNLTIIDEMKEVAILSMEDDMENYIRYKLMGGNKILKRCVVPHIFQCQADRKRAAEEFIRNVASKRVRRRLLEEAVSLCTNPNEVLKDCCIRLEDIAHMLKGKETVNLKDLKELQEDRMKKTVTKNKTLDVTNCGFKKLNNKLLSMKRKRDTGQSCYRNNPKKCKMGTSEDRIFEVLGGHEPVGCATSMVNIPSDCELLESSTKFDQDSGICERLQYESMACSSSGLQVPMNRGYTVCSAIENDLENEIITSDLSSNDTSFVIPAEHIKQEVTVFKQEITDLETSHSSAGPEDSNICEETFTNWQDVIVKEEVTIEEHPYFEDLNFGEEIKECSALNVDCVDSEYQNMNSEELSIAFVSSKEMPNHTYFSDGYRHLQHMLPEIKSQELTCSEEGSLQNVENMAERSTECVRKMVFVERTAGKIVKQAGNMRLRVTPDFLKQTGIVPRRPLFGAAAEVMNEMDKALGIHLPPFSLEQIGSLKWIQYTIAIDHPYSREAEEPTVKECHICEICRKVVSACNVNRHMNSHFKNSAFTCNYCGKRICSFQLWTKHRQNCFAGNRYKMKTREWF